ASPGGVCPAPPRPRPDDRFPVAVSGFLIGARRGREVLAVYQAIGLYLLGLSLVEDISRDLVRLGGQGLLASCRGRRVRLIEGALHEGPLALLLLLRRDLLQRGLVLGPGLAEQADRRRVVRLPERGDAIALLALRRGEALAREELRGHALGRALRLGHPQPGLLRVLARTRGHRGDHRRLVALARRRARPVRLARWRRRARPVRLARWRRRGSRRGRGRGRRLLDLSVGLRRVRR